MFSGKTPSSIDLLNIISSGTLICTARDFSSRLLMLSYLLLLFFGRFFINAKISCVVVGARNILVSCWFRLLRYSLSSEGLQVCCFAKLSPTEEKNSLNEFVIESLSYLITLSTFTDSMVLCLLFSLPIILFISC